MISIDEARDQLAQEKAELEKEMSAEIAPTVKAQERAYFAKEPEPEKDKGVLDYAASTSLGLAGGFSNAVADGINTVTDVMFMAGVNLAAAIDSSVDESTALKMWQDGRDKFTGFLQTKDDDDEVKNFVMNTTEALAKFAFIWTELGTAGGKSGMTLAGAAGAGAGVTNGPVRELLWLDRAARVRCHAVWRCAGSPCSRRRPATAFARGTRGTRFAHQRACGRASAAKPRRGAFRLPCRNR